MSGMRSATSIRRTIAAAAALLVLLAACSTPTDDRTETAVETPAPAGATSAEETPMHEMDDMDAGGDHSDRGHASNGGHHSDGGHAARSDGHSEGHQTSDADLEPFLLDLGDVVEGYLAGAHHQGVYTPTGPFTLAAECLPIAELIGTEPSVQQDEHPEARLGFTKSHFGPQLSETIIDYGDDAAASQAMERVESAIEECDLYRQSMLPVGATLYDVEPLRFVSVGDASTALHLDARGADFRDVFWDLVVARSGSYVVAVGFRSAFGSTIGDLRQAVPAAVDKLDRAA